MLLVCWRSIWTGKNAFLKRVHTVLHSWGGLEESGGMWCWGVVGEMWPDSQVGFVRPAFPTFPTDQRAALTPPTMTFSSASFNTAPLSIVPTSCTAVFPGRRNLACGAGHNVSRLRRWWWQWRWQWWQRPLPTRSTLLSSASLQNPLTFPEIFFVATQGSHIEFTYLGCHS